MVWCSWSFYPITMWMNSRVLLGAVNMFWGVLVCCYGVKGGCHVFWVLEIIITCCYVVKWLLGCCGGCQYVFVFAKVFWLYSTSLCS